MYKELVRLGEASEDIYVLEFDEPSCITLGLCHEERPRFSGGAYHPVLKRVEEFLKQPLREVMSLRQQRAKTLLELDDLIVKQAEALKTRGRPAPISKASSSLA